MAGVLSTHVASSSQQSALCRVCLNRWLATCRSPISAVQWSHNGRYIVSGGGDKSLILWNVLTGEQVRAVGRRGLGRPGGRNSWRATPTITCTWQGGLKANTIFATLRIAAACPAPCRWRAVHLNSPSSYPGHRHLLAQHPF